MRLSIIESIRTHNFNDSEILTKIQKLWKVSIPKIQDYKYEGVIYGVYHKYESDYKGDYTLSVMIEDSEGVIDIPEDKYKKFTVEKAGAEGVFSTWKQIWELEEEGKLERAYTYDFERYDPSGEIKIYIKEK